MKSDLLREWTLMSHVKILSRVEVSLVSRVSDESWQDFDESCQDPDRTLTFDESCQDSDVSRLRLVHYVYVCIHIYMCIYVYIYIYIYLYIYILYVYIER